ncbi:hypothetical protein LDENG_00160600 [Lucifuga dentata]|nr:hypothetical protein LDENG_00160600 [Lucifuga dentata]
MYVSSTQNPEDDLTRGLTLAELSGLCRWNSGPTMLRQPPGEWPNVPDIKAEPDEGELKRSAFVGSISVMSDFQLPDSSQFSSWKELVQAQLGSFPEEIKAQKAKQPIPTDSHLSSLTPEYDEATGLIRVEGRLCHAEHLELEAVHPIVLDSRHQVTKLLIQHYDQKLLYPGSERVLAELRRQYWVLRGQEAIQKHQHANRDCQHWWAKPDIPKMADLPPCRLHLYKPPFYSTGMGCFGPFTVKIGQQQEKRWGSCLSA